MIVNTRKVNINMTKNREKSQVTRKIVKLAIFSNFRNSVWLSDYEQDKKLRKIVRLAIFRNTRKIAILLLRANLDTSGIRTLDLCDTGAAHR